MKEDPQFEGSGIVDPVTNDELPQVDGAISVGEDLAFQERWWKFERVTWVFFATVLLADILGVFGGGPLSKSTVSEAGLGMRVQYERVERTGTPSMMNIQFEPDAVQNGKVQIYVSSSVVKGLGAQRVIPEPESTELTQQGMTYTFPATVLPGQIGIELQPGAPGFQTMRLQIPGKVVLNRRILVMP